MGIPRPIGQILWDLATKVVKSKVEKGDGEGLQGLIRAMENIMEREPDLNMLSDAGIKKLKRALKRAGHPLPK